jgi:GGDEF domain-containing protein
MNKDKKYERKNFSKYTFSNTGIIVFLDLDRFRECVKEKNWSEYAPNKFSGFLTNRLLEYTRKYQAVHLWGINKRRGTEEAILLFLQEKKQVKAIFEKLRKKICNMAKEIGVNTSLSVGIAEGTIQNLKKIKSHAKKEFMNNPTVYLAYKALKEAKKKGGNKIISY